MADVFAAGGKFEGYVMVYDKNGKPKVDCPHVLPLPLMQLLTEAEKEELFATHETCPLCKDREGDS